VSTVDLGGKRVVVTGAAGGLGRDFALDLAQAGAQVLVADINAGGAADTARMVTEAGGICIAQAVDVTSTDSCQTLAKTAHEAFGGVDVLVNNAALYGGLERMDFEQFDEAVWDQVMAVNIKGVWQMCRAFSPMLRASGKGSIINIASATVFSGSPQWMHYVASKGAVIAMTRVMAKEMGSDSVRVNAIAPGFTLTEASYGHIEDAKGYGVGRAALKRNAETADITGGVLYLASDLSGFVTGQTLVIDGGKQFI
jgi:NAD(P)-dependent dehydrogenase (short-subunit alcohol dehydrogenase family)